MILARHRPVSLDAALSLLERQSPLTLAMGGGFLLERAPVQLEAVELDALGLDGLDKRGKYLEIGACLKLQALGENPDAPAGLRQVIESFSQPDARRSTLAGSLVAASGRSSLAAALQALDAQVYMAGDGRPIELGQILLSRTYYPGLPALPGQLITRLTVNTEAAIYFETHGSQPEAPTVILAAARWPSGRTRVVVGGWGRTPRLALDAPEAGGLDTAVASALEEASDEAAIAGERVRAAGEMVNRAKRFFEL